MIAAVFAFIKSQPTLIYLFIGSEGSNVTELNRATGKAFNGGGIGTTTVDPNNPRSAGSGGGGTDIRLLNQSLYNRIIVAGGGGGCTEAEGFNVNAGYGGGLVGGDTPTGGKGGTQENAPELNSSFITGSFGEGGSNEGTGNIQYTTGGGGGGWFGGSTGQLGLAGGGAGGSGYVLHANSVKPDGYKLDYPKYYLKLWTIRNGNNKFETCEGELFVNTNEEQGHSGDGCIRITEFQNFPITCLHKQTLKFVLFFILLLLYSYSYKI